MNSWPTLLATTQHLIYLSWWQLCPPKWLWNYLELLTFLTYIVRLTTSPQKGSVNFQNMLMLRLIQEKDRRKLGHWSFHGAALLIHTGSVQKFWMSKINSDFIMLLWTHIYHIPSNLILSDTDNCFLYNS